MKIIIYSDLHLEFGTDFKPPFDGDADLMILAGDIITFRDYRPLNRLLECWQKPVLYIAGNHEYYNTLEPINKENDKLKEWLAANHDNVTFLYDEEITIDQINFFGGIMWTDFNNKDAQAMRLAHQAMNDYRYIKVKPNSLLKPTDTVYLHEKFMKKLIYWFKKDLTGPRVVISHHAPVINKNTKHVNSPLMPAFNSLDMLKIIDKYQPDLWVYGHTHECDNQIYGRTKIVSNQLGYPGHYGHYECEDFDNNGAPVEIYSLR